MNHLCVFDMDETLLNSDKSVSEENLRAIQLLKDLGIGVTIATGRSPLLTGVYSDLLSLDLPIVACNGGIVFDPLTNDIIWQNPLHPTLLDRALRYLLDRKADFIAHSNFSIFYSPYCKHYQQFVAYNNMASASRQVPLHQLKDTDSSAVLPEILKVLMWDPTEDDAVFFKSIAGSEVLSSMSDVLDVMQEGSTKGQGVLHLAKYLDIPPANIAVFGDNENDVSMFSCGALSVAMGNSSDEIKKQADFVTLSNNDAGIAYAIRNFVLPHFGYNEKGT